MKSNVKTEQDYPTADVLATNFRHIGFKITFVDFRVMRSRKKERKACRKSIEKMFKLDE